jgi:hypothetical protein
MRQNRVLVHHRSRLGTAVSVQAIQAERGNPMAAIRAFECDTTICIFCRVMSHACIVSLRTSDGIGQQVCILRETLNKLVSLDQ